MRKSKQQVARLVVVLLYIFWGQAFWAAAAWADEVSIVVNGNKLSTDVAPYIEEGRVLVPFRALFEALGATVEWNAASQAITGKKDGKEVRLTIGSKTAYVDGKAVALDVPAAITSGRTFVPLRLVAESLGIQVSWNEATQTVTVLTGETTGATTGRSSCRAVFVRDALKRNVYLLSPPARIVVCDGFIAETICALGGASKIVGVPNNKFRDEVFGEAVFADPLLAYELQGTEDIIDPAVAKVKSKGYTSGDFSAERIISLKPDVVFASPLQQGEVTAKVQRYGIPVVFLDCYSLESLQESLAILGKILDHEERASKLAGFIEQQKKAVVDKLANLSLSEVPSVYLEGSPDYVACNVGTCEGNLLKMVAAKNITATLMTLRPKVSPEFVLAHNPKVVVKCPNFDPDGENVPSGYELTDDALRKKRDDVMGRPGWQKIDAVKSGRVYVLSRWLVAGPQAVVGLLYLAKWLYPNYFADVEPKAVHKSLIEGFYGLPYRGAWVAPGE